MTSVYCVCVCGIWYRYKTSVPGLLRHVYDDLLQPWPPCLADSSCLSPLGASPVNRDQLKSPVFSRTLRSSAKKRRTLSPDQTKWVEVVIIVGNCIFVYDITTIYLHLLPFSVMCGLSTIKIVEFDLLFSVVYCFNLTIVSCIKHKLRTIWNNLLICFY